MRGIFTIHFHCVKFCSFQFGPQTLFLGKQVLFFGPFFKREEREGLPDFSSRERNLLLAPI
jgi:hypothetical protein